MNEETVRDRCDEPDLLRSRVAALVPPPVRGPLLSWAGVVVGCGGCSGAPRPSQPDNCAPSGSTGYRLEELKCIEIKRGSQPALTDEFGDPLNFDTCEC
jgi:hypothetical protein